MPKGRIVIVSTERLGGGPFAHDIFGVAIDDDQKAVDAVKKAIEATPDQQVWAAKTVSENAIKGLGLIDGEVKNAASW